MRSFCTLLLAASCLAIPTYSSAQHVVEIEFTPTTRAQIAIWLETADGEFVQTLKLTESVALRGLGNRPGATQMNSGFHWPFGRREGVLPVWAHRRLSAEGAESFRRVIFQDRRSEGFASRTSFDTSPDDYYCLSFNNMASGRDQLDAVTCPSQFNSDKGRYLTNDDVQAGYSEPFEAERGASTDNRALGLNSVYPPRRDLPGQRGADHADVVTYAADARRIMPEIDAITMATLPGAASRQIQISLPATLPEGDYILRMEVNVEGDYGPDWDPARFPTPMLGAGWDFWAKTYGYPYRGQPSLVYRLPFTLDPSGGSWSASEPEGYGDIHGANGDITPMDLSIVDDPDGAPGSGADRLAMGALGRLSIMVVPSNVCGGDDPPPECFVECDDETRFCAAGFVCNSESMCVGRCDEPMPPSAIRDFTLTLDEDRSWEYAHLRFTMPASAHALTAYRVRVNTEPFVAGMNFASWGTEAKIASLEDVALIVPVEGEVGDVVEASLGHLLRQTLQYVAIQAIDDCGTVSPVTSQSIETTEIIFTTVSPCFVATAAYGSPMASEIGTLRRFRDRHLLNNELGRTLVDGYYSVGPTLADWIREDDDSREVVRTLLSPIIDVLDWLES